jgi:hypothetical protein
MATCAVMGQALGTAAALCTRHGITPRQLTKDTIRLKELQQTLLRDDQTIKNRKNEDPNDLARQSTVTASGVFETGKPELVIDGVTRDMPGEIQHRWAAPMTDRGAWIELSWDKPQTIRHVQITFDSGFHRELTLTASDSHNSKMIRAPQPETVRDYVIKVRSPEGQWQEVARVAGNHQRLRRHDFEPTTASAVRVEVSATNGAEEARIYEIRCYG